MHFELGFGGSLSASSFTLALAHSSTIVSNRGNLPVSNLLNINFLFRVTSNDVERPFEP